MPSVMEQADAVADGLDAYLAALPSDRWTRPSDCAGWSVADIVSHLVLVQQLLGGSVTRGLRGDPGPQPGIDGPEAWRAYRAREITRLSALPTAELRVAFRDGLGPLRRTMAEVPGAEPSLRGWHPAGPQLLAWFPGQWLVEVALHDWDLRVALDPEATPNQAAHSALGPEMRARLPRCYRPEDGTARDGLVRIDLDGSTPWLARLSGGSLQTLDDGAARPDATIRTDAGSWALAQTARRPAAYFAERGRWRTSGDAALADHLAASFAGY